MPSHRYHYPIFESDGVYRPLVPVRFTNPFTGRSLIWDCLLDSGASVCIIPGAIAQLTGHNLDGPDVESRVTTGIERTSIPTYLHTFVLELMHPTNLERVIWRGRRSRYHCVTQTQFAPLLGSRDFLRHFRIALDYPKAQTTISWSD